MRRFLSSRSFFVVNNDQVTEDFIHSAQKNQLGKHSATRNFSIMNTDNQDKTKYLFFGSDQNGRQWFLISEQISHEYLST